jgi:hypothetical protein
MTLATKNGSLIVKDGQIAENCGCCGGWWCYRCGCDKPTVVVTLSNFSAYYQFSTLSVNGTYTLSHPNSGLASCCDLWGYRYDNSAETCGTTTATAFLQINLTRSGIAVSARGRTNLQTNFPSGGLCAEWTFAAGVSDICVTSPQSGSAFLSGLSGPIYSFNWSAS